MSKIADAHPRPPRGLGKIASHFPGWGFAEAPPELVDRVSERYADRDAAWLGELVREMAGEDSYPKTVGRADALLVLASFEHDNPY